MTLLPQNSNRLFQVFLLHEQVIRVEGRDSEHANPGFGQRNCQRGEDADDRERDRLGHPKAAPAPLAQDAIRHGVLATDDEEFVGGASACEEAACGGPSWNRGSTAQPAHGEKIVKSEERTCPALPNRADFME